MAMGKLTLLIGAGILGSILAKDNRIPSVSDVISGTLKLALKPIKGSDSASSTSKSRNDALMTEVTNLRQTLQLISSSKSMTVVTSNATGGRQYGAIVVIIAVGCGYVWWKGWKIPDFMFATKRGLSDACDSVAKQLDEVFRSLRITRNEISSKIGQSSDKFDEIIACSIATKEEVAEVHGDVLNITVDLQDFDEKIQTLETRMGRIQEKQGDTKEGVAKLLLYTLDVGNARFADCIQDSPSGASRLAIEHQAAMPSRSGSLPLTLEPSIPSTSYGFNEEFQGNSGSVQNNSSPRISSRNLVTEITEKPLSPDLPATQPNAKTAGLLSRTISATRYFKFM